MNSGDVVIVTGAGRGIGRAVAENLAAAGADIVVNDVDPITAEDTCERVRALGRQALCVAENIGNPVGARGVADAAFDAFGRVDAVVNNAAIFRPTPILDVEPARFRELLAVNVGGPLVLS